jgi:hypothetical protein
VAAGILFITKPSISIGAALVIGLITFLLFLKNGYFQNASLAIDADTIWIREKKRTEKLPLKEITELSFARYYEGPGPFIAKVESPTYDSPQVGEKIENFGINSQRLEIKPWIPAILVFMPFGVLITWKDKIKKTFIPSAHPKQLMQALKTQ